MTTEHRELVEFCLDTIIHHITAQDPRVTPEEIYRAVQDELRLRDMHDMRGRGLRELPDTAKVGPGKKQ